jgi:RanBP1 domain
MEGPPRANAAQLAARKIKEKPKAKRSGSGRLDHSTPQWAAQSPQPGEGLFGGSVQSSGTFNFSGPALAPSFPPSFGNGGGVFGGGSNGGFGGINNGQPPNALEQESDRPVDDRPSKKLFGNSTPSTQNTTFQMPNTFGQSSSTSTGLFGSSNPSQGGSNMLLGGAPPSPTTSFGTAAPAQTQPNNTFSFGTPASKLPLSPSINFGSDSTADKPASNPFSFGRPPSQPPQSPAPATSIFNQGPTNSETKPPSSPFSFGQSSETPSSSGINFGSTPAAESPTKDFFGQLSKTPSSSGINFGATPAAKSPIKDFFGNPQRQSSAQPTSLFGTSDTAESPVKDFFGNPSSGLNTTDSPKPQTSNLFGSTQSAAPPVNGLFGNKPQSSTNGTSNPFAQNQQPVQSLINLFGSSSQALTASSTFGEQKSQPTSSILDGSMPKQPSSNFFGGLKPQDEQVNNFFTSPSKPAASTKDLFESPNKPSDQPAVQFNANGAEKDRQVSPEKPSTPTSDLFANLNKPLGQSATEPKINGAGNTAGSAPAKPVASVNGLFGTPNKPFNQPEVRPAFSEQNQVTKSPERSSTQGQSTQQIDWAKVDWEQFRGVTMESHKKLQPKLRVFAQDVPFVSARPASRSFYTGADFAKFKEPQSDLPYTPEVVSLIDLTSKAEVEQNFRAYELLSPAIPEKAPSMTNEEGGLVHDINGELGDYPKLFPGLYFAKTFPLEYMASLVPEHFSPELRVEFYVAYRMKILNNELRKYFDTVSVTTNVIPAITYYQVQRKQILRRGTAEYTMELRRLGVEPQLTQANGKGKAQRVADDENLENEPPSKRTKQVGLPNAVQQSNEQSASASPRPAQVANSQPYLNGNMATTSSTPLFQPSVPYPSATASPSKGKRKGDDLDQDMPQPKRNSPLKQANMQSLNGDGGGSSTSQKFLDILGSPSKSNSTAKPSPERNIIGSPAKPAEDAPRINPFGNLPVPASPTATKTASVSPGNLFAPKTPSSLTKSSPNPAAVSAAPPNPFVPKPSSGNSNLTSSNPIAAFSFTLGATGQNAPATKPPTFGSVNFAAQFAEKAAKDKEDHEEKLLQKAIDADYDSDDDNKEEFIANFRKKRAAEVKKAEEEAKSSRGGFVPVPGKGSAFGGSAPMFNANTSSGKSPTKATADSQPPAPTFGQKPPQNSSTGFFSPSPMNGSRASTPGAISSPGSVLDGHVPGKIVNFGNNFFSNLTSDAGSGKDDDADEEDADEDDGGESDSENKDPNYQPGEESNSGPGTPASETGAGIASAKKSTNTLNFGQSKLGGTFGAASYSGSSTPGKSLSERPPLPTGKGGLFDRVSLPDASNSPSEEKENAQPNAASPLPNSKSLSSFNKSMDSAADYTWNEDSPIKFGATTPNGDAKSDAPTLSVTAATPTKSSSTFGSSLFGNTKDSKAPQSNFFGSTTNSKPSVGFGFGTSSTGSSLFPSAAVSASTSRATSPGATTDGDSGVEGDPDAERHEQLDLTSGGPGEEDEEVLHEVRAKAVKFVTKDGQSAWETKGLGPLRVLKNKDIKATRMLLRGDPSGKIVLNKGLLPNIKYEATGKTVKVMALGEKGEGLETWVMQVKTQEFAEALAEVLEANKPSS